MPEKQLIDFSGCEHMVSHRKNGATHPRAGGAGLWIKPVRAKVYAQWVAVRANRCSRLQL